MPSIIKRGISYRAQISLYNHGQHKKLTKSFSSKKEATRWALENELEKGNGKQLAERTTTFADFFENWIHIIKKNDVKATFFVVGEKVELSKDFSSGEEIIWRYTVKGFERYCSTTKNR